MGAIRLEDLPQYTYEDYKQWDGDWELMWGVAYAMSPVPVNKHQLLNTKIARELDEAIDNCSKCLALIEADWKVADNMVLRPDASLICYEPEDYLTKAPEIIFEIISPSTASRDENLKFNVYEQEGVKYYILVYPDNLMAKVYKLRDGKFIKVGDFDDESYEFETKFCKINFNFDNIFKRFRK